MSEKAESVIILDQSSILTTNCFILKTLNNEALNDAFKMLKKFY